VHWLLVALTHVSDDVQLVTDGQAVQDIAPALA
jgi:hypothetical protein